MINCVRCNDTGMVRTTTLIMNNYNIKVESCNCKNSKEVKVDESHFEIRARHDKIDRMKTKEVLQYIRDTIAGKEWDGGMREVKKIEKDLDDEDYCPF